MISQQDSHLYRTINRLNHLRLNEDFQSIFQVYSKGEIFKTVNSSEIYSGRWNLTLPLPLTVSFPLWHQKLKLIIKMETTIIRYFSYTHNDNYLPPETKFYYSLCKSGISSLVSRVVRFYIKTLPIKNKLRHSDSIFRIRH